MENYTFIKIIIDLIKILPIGLAGIYFGVYATVYFSFFKRIEKKRTEIRNNILKYWKVTYLDFHKFFDNVPISDIRMIAKLNQQEKKSFRKFQIFFFIGSILLCPIAIILSNVLSPENFLIIYYSSIVLFVGYIITCTFLFSSTQYEWKFYSRLDELQNDIKN